MKLRPGRSDGSKTAWLVAILNTAVLIAVLVVAIVGDHWLFILAAVWLFVAVGWTYRATRPKP